MFSALECISDRHFLITCRCTSKAFYYYFSWYRRYHFLAVLSCVYEVLGMIAKSHRRMSVMFWQNKQEELGVQSDCFVFKIYKYNSFSRLELRNFVKSIMWSYSWIKIVKYNFWSIIYLYWSIIYLYLLHCFNFLRE